MEIKKVLLKNYSSLRIGGEADMVVVKNEEELVEAVMHAASKGRRVHILGEGTNTYFGEKLENLLVIKNEIKGIFLKILDDQTIRQSDVSFELTAGAGENWDDVVKYTVENNLWGIENLSYIPGTVGASPVQNIGAYGMELQDALVSVRAYDIEKKEFIELRNEECQFGYRDSIFKNNVGRYCVISVTLKLSKEPRPVLIYKPLDTLSGNSNITLQEIRDIVIKTRKEKLPDYTLYPNTGSFFKNAFITKEKGDELIKNYTTVPLHDVVGGYKVSTAWLIEHVAQMKGVRVGDVGTWPIQPLVLVNYGDVTTKELHIFAATIIKKIEEKTGITIEREVNCIE